MEAHDVSIHQVLIFRSITDTVAAMTSISTLDRSPATLRRRPRILLVSGWQTVNIGDVAHTPGVLTALQRFAADCEVGLLACSLDERELAMLRREFPEVEILRSRTGGADEHVVRQRAFDWADLLLHGSGPSVAAAGELDLWRRTTTKPYGVFGVTVDPLAPHHGTLAEVRSMIDALPATMIGDDLRAVLDDAAFVFCRDSLSTSYLRKQGLRCPEIAFGPDATIAFDRPDRDAAAATLQGLGLRRGEFFCVVPRLRFTPYHRIRGTAAGPEEHRRDAVNAAHAPTDLGVLREAVVRHVRTSGQRALVVPEMTYQVALGQEWFDRDALPDDVAPHVDVLPRFWDLAEAAGVYAEASAVLSMECHSPLIAVAAGTPAAYLRQPTDTIKGQMHPDLGTPTFDVGPKALPGLTAWLSRTAVDPAGARAVAHRTRSLAEQHLASMAAAVLASVAAPSRR
jgi:hypothetical protein